jgi:hypothetical protein
LLRFRTFTTEIFAICRTSHGGSEAALLGMVLILSKAFGAEPVLRELSVEPPQLVTILGASGAGKTTLLKSSWPGANSFRATRTPRDVRVRG